MSEYKLLAGVDRGKDQSYFLWTLTQKELSKTLFPVGEYKKGEVRKLAEKFGLPTAQKKDSQGLCFMGRLDMKDFLQHFIRGKNGDVIDTSGEVLGSHHGAVFLTLGERHGFTITKKGTNDMPYYVVAKDIKKNTITVSHEPLSKDQDGVGKNASLSSVNWIMGAPPVIGKSYASRLRYRQPLEKCEIIFIGNDRTEVGFKKEQLASPGQSLVLYDGDECLGGGIIE